MGSDIVEEHGSELGYVKKYGRRAFQAEAIPISEDGNLKEPGIHGEYGMWPVWNLR